MVKAILIFFVALFTLSSTLLNVSLATNSVVKKEGAYQIVEGNVSEIKTRILVIDGRQYPISVFVRVFDSRTPTLREMRLQELVAVGRVDKVRIYLLRDKVEKIYVLKHI